MGLQITLRSRVHRIETSTIVGNDRFERVSINGANTDFHVFCSRVLAYIGERLLDDPQQLQLGRRRQRAQRRLRLHSEEGINLALFLPPAEVILERVLQWT